MSVVCDGMTRKGYIEARRGVSEAVRFEYRPLSNPRRSRYHDSVKGLSGSATEQIAAELCSRLLVFWNLRYPMSYPVVEKRGDGVPFDALWTDVDPWVTSRIISIILGYIVSDVDPDDNPEQQKKTQGLKDSPANKVSEILSGEESERLGN